MTIKYYVLKEDLTISLVQSNPKVICAKIIIQKNMRYPGVEKIDNDKEVILYIHEHSTIIELEVLKEDLIEIS